MLSVLGHLKCCRFHYWIPLMRAVHNTLEEKALLGYVWQSTEYTSAFGTTQSLSCSLHKKNCLIFAFSKTCICFNMHRQEHFYFIKNWYFEFSFLASQTRKLGSHRGDKVHHLFSLPEIDMVGTIKGLSSNLHLRRWVVRPRSKSFDIYSTDSSANRVSFLLCWKICKYEVCFK